MPQYVWKGCQLDFSFTGIAANGPEPATSWENIIFSRTFTTSILYAGNSVRWAWGGLWFAVVGVGRVALGYGEGSVNGVVCDHKQGGRCCRVGLVVVIVGLWSREESVGYVACDHKRVLDRCSRVGPVAAIGGLWMVPLAPAPLLATAETEARSLGSHRFPPVRKPGDEPWAKAMECGGGSWRWGFLFL
ncbi:MAG: hypothetical protein GY832_30815 [Chloroflexi bacterium]|nr:hypothetical protein [Chloroflexota bacterium]